MSEVEFERLLDEMVGQKIASLRLGSEPPGALEIELKNGRYFHLIEGHLNRGPMSGRTRVDATELARAAFKGGPVVRGVRALMLDDRLLGIAFDFSTGASLAYDWRDGEASFR